MKLLKRLFSPEIRMERKFLDRAYKDASEAVFAARLNAATTRKVRENIRRDLDAVNDRIRALEEKIVELLAKLGIDAELREQLEKTADIIPNSELVGLNPEAKDKAIKDAAKRTRRMRADWINDEIGGKLKMMHGDERKEERERLGKITKEIIQTIEIKQDVETSAEKMRNQMRGRWNVGEQKYEAGLDQRLGEIAQQIAGGEDVKRVIRQLHKKL